MANQIQRGQTLSTQMYEILWHRIGQMTAGENQLPSEEILSKEYGVSRAIIREACSKLVEQGYLAKGPGRGLVCHPSALNMENRIDLISDFKALVGQKFKAVSMKVSNIHQDAENFYMDWTYYGNKQPVIFCCYTIPLSSFSTLPTGRIAVQDLPEFSAEYLPNPISYCSMELHCCLAPEIATIFQIPDNCPMQRFDEILYDVADNAIGRSTCYLHPDAIPLTVLTKFR